jgi:hypothetical protein
MTTTESIIWLESAIAHERAVASSWSLAGWPDCANSYRRNAAKAMRILKRVRAAAFPPTNNQTRI